MDSQLIYGVLAALGLFHCVHVVWKSFFNNGIKWRRSISTNGNVTMDGNRIVCTPSGSGPGSATFGGKIYIFYRRLVIRDRHVEIDGREMTLEAAGMLDRPIVLEVSGSVAVTCPGASTVTVKGDCNTVTTASGDIQVTGNVGMAQTASGNIDIHGNVTRHASTVSGDITYTGRRT